MNDIQELLTRGVANIIPGKNELFGKLSSGKKLNVYFGIDPTSTKIHLGHAVPIRKLAGFANLGHNVTFLIGDFTALIGDTSDKDSERPALTIEEIDENFKTYKKQAEKILDFSRVQIRYNSEWLKKLTFEDIIKLTQHFSANDLLSRELIKKRLTEGKRIGLHEFLYPVMQGYDSYFMDTDLQIGGTDQTYNMQAGRTLQKELRKKESFVLTTPILEGTDGKKMSKSWGNAIWLDDKPNDMYAKAMAIDDSLIMQYFTLATNLPLQVINKYQQKLKKENPINIKKILAHQIVKELHDEKSADHAQKNFKSTVQEKNINALDMYNFEGTPGLNVVDIMIKFKLALSNTDAKRLIKQKAVSLNNKIIDNHNLTLSDKGEYLLEVGNINKRKPIKIVIKSH